MKEAKIFVDTNGSHISMIDSYIAWTEITKEMSMLDTQNPYENKVCKFCDGFEEVVSNKYGKIHCLCRLRTEEKMLMQINSNFADLHEKKYINDLQIWGDKDSQKELMELKKEFIKWMEYPDYWITIHGIPGSGKSHLLMSAAEYFKNWSLYITTSSLESRIFQAMEDESLQSLVDTIKRIPILLLDDIGSDYGKDFARSVIRKILDYRYMLAKQFPTVITTNLGTTGLIAYDARIADRVHDKQIAKTFILKHVLSWRTK